MRSAITLLFVIAAVAAVLVVGGGREAVGETPTPAPTASPVPSETPLPTAYPQSKITILFLRDGVPVVFPMFLDVPRRYFANGEDCNFPIGSFGLENPVVLNWPAFPPGSSNPLACSSGPPTTITIDFMEGWSQDVYWTGSDVNLEVELPLNVPTAKPTGITLRFVQNGQPVGLLGSSLGVTPTVNGVQCHTRVTVVDVASPWPPAYFDRATMDIGTTVGCPVQLPAEVRVKVNGFEVVFQWTGQSEVEVEVPEWVETIALPVVPPKSGGPVEGGSDDTWRFVVGLALAALGVIGAAVVGVRRVGPHP